MLLLLLLLTQTQCTNNTRATFQTEKNKLKTYALNRVYSDMNRLEILNTLLPYSGELLRIYLKEKKCKVPDTTWYDIEQARIWILSHKELFKDTLYVKDVISVFQALKLSNGIIITRRVKRAKFEWEMKARDGYIYIPEPRKIMVAYPDRVVYFKKILDKVPYCGNPSERNRMLFTFRTYPHVSGLIMGIDLTKEKTMGEAILIPFMETKYSWREIKIKDMPFLWEKLTRMINDSCIRYADRFYILKDGRWYATFPILKSELEELKKNGYKPIRRSDAVMETDELSVLPSTYIIFDSPEKGKKLYELSFSNKAFEDVLRFLRGF